MRRAEFHSTQISNHCSQTMSALPLKATACGKYFVVLQLDNIAHSRDRI